jgi:ornithine carbamoyltransferase
MTPAFHAPELPDALNPDNHAGTELLLQAESLVAASIVGKLPMPLRGKKLGIFCNHPGGAAATLFASAASELGAHVVCIPITLTDQSSLTVIRDTAVLLSRLYDAVECLDMSPLLVELMQESANIPLFFGLSSDAQWTAALATRMSLRPGLPPNARRHMLQAALVQALPS